MSVKLQGTCGRPNLGSHPRHCAQERHAQFLEMKREAAEIAHTTAMERPGHFLRQPIRPDNEGKRHCRDTTVKAD